MVTPSAKLARLSVAIAPTITRNQGWRSKDDNEEGRTVFRAYMIIVADTSWATVWQGDKNKHNIYCKDLERGQLVLTCHLFFSKKKSIPEQDSNSDMKEF